MAMGEVKLIGAKISPFVNRVQFVLNLKSINYEFVEETIGSKSELLLKSNPVYKKIPVLIHNDKPICESLVIVEYLDELWTAAPSILPTDPYDRALARFWAAYIDDKLVPILRELIMAKGEEQKLVLRNQVVDSLVLLDGAFIQCSKGLDFFGGNKIGYLDIALGCFLVWLKALEKHADLELFDKTKAPNLMKWAVRFCSDDSTKDVIPEVEAVIEFAKVLAKMNEA